jgi:hypothetical protein
MDRSRSCGGSNPCSSFLVLRSSGSASCLVGLGNAEVEARGPRREARIRHAATGRTRRRTRRRCNVTAEYHGFSCANRRLRPLGRADVDRCARDVVRVWSAGTVRSGPDREQHDADTRTDGQRLFARVLGEEHGELADLRPKMNRLPLLRSAGQARLHEPLAKTDVPCHRSLVVGGRSYHAGKMRPKCGRSASDLPRLERVRSLSSLRVQLGTHADCLRGVHRWVRQSLASHAC